MAALRSRSTGLHATRVLLNRDQEQARTIAGVMRVLDLDTDGKQTTVDNPYQLANSKAKKLRSLLQRQKAAKSKGQIPFIEALVFCSAENLQCDLQGNAKFHVCLRDRAADGVKPARPGIMAAIKRRECDGLDPVAKGTHDRPTAKVVAQAIEQSGIRPSQRSRKVSDYVLDRLINEGLAIRLGSNAFDAEDRSTSRAYL